MWGKHERLLNNIELRFEMGLITNLFNYFQEPWISALYIADYKKFERETKELLSTLSNVEGSSLIEDILKQFEMNNWKEVSFRWINVLN